MRNWFTRLLKTYWRSLSVVLLIVLLNFVLVTRVVGLAYGSFSWSGFAQVYGPYGDDEEEDEGEEEDEDQPYGEITPVATIEPYSEVTLPPPPTEVPTEEPYATLDLPTATPLPTARPLDTPAPTTEADLYADLTLPIADTSPITGTTPITPTSETPSAGFLNGPGFLGTNAPLKADLALLGEIGIYLLLLLGVAVQLMRLWKAHDWIMTLVVVSNLFFIVFLMLASYGASVSYLVSGNAEIGPGLFLPLLHGVLGGLAELVAIYCMLAGHKILPRKIGTLRYFMWTTFVLWTMAIVLGVGTYIIYYVNLGGGQEDQAVTEVVPTPIAPEDLPPDLPPPPQRILLQNFVFSPSTMTVIEGTNLTWVNQDVAPHNVTFANDGPTSGDFGQSGSFTFTFDDPGEYVIYCTLHGSPGTGMSSTINVVERSPEAVAEVLAQPTPVPLPPTPAPAPVVPPPPIALIEPPAPEIQVAGLVAFYDQTHSSDSVVVTLNGLTPPPPGFVYVGWLVNGLVNQVLNIGPITVAENGVVNYSYTSPTGENLLAQFDGFQMTLEAAGSEATLVPGTVVYSGRQPRQATEMIRRMTVAAATPGNLGYATAARLQVEELIRHVEFVRVALDLLSIADAQRHSEHILNVLLGAQAAQDLDGKHGVQNPGDTFGIIPYLENLRATAQTAAAAPDATNAIRIHSTHVEMSTTNALAWAAEIQQAVIDIGNAASVGDIAADVATLERASNLLLWGEDTDGDGTVEPEEGAVFTAYQHAQYTGAIGVMAGNLAAVVDPEPVTNEVLVATNAGELVVQMLDFFNDPNILSVPTGTVIRFLNSGQALHSATADDGTFDTGLISNGQSQAFTFDQPGTYSYYCTLHGLPGGVGMSGTIEVTQP